MGIKKPVKLVVKKIKDLKLEIEIKKNQRNKAKDSGIIYNSINASLPFTSKAY